MTTPPGRQLHTGITVLGLGNPIMGDDGVGIVLLEALMALDLEGAVTFVDGGIIGMSLLPAVADAGSLLVLDAVAGTAGGDGSGGEGSGGEGSGGDGVGEDGVVHLVGDQLPRLIRGKLSPHQVGLLDVLAAARLLGTEPGRLAVIGIAPVAVEMGVGLTAGVAASVPAAVEAAHRVLRGWWADERPAAAPTPPALGIACGVDSRHSSGVAIAVS